jgi:hypothetical protein
MPRLGTLRRARAREFSGEESVSLLGHSIDREVVDAAVEDVADWVLVVAEAARAE